MKSISIVAIALGAIAGSTAISLPQAYSQSCSEAESCSRQTDKPVFLPKDPRANKTAKGKDCIRRYGACVASNRYSKNTRLYRQKYVDAQRRDREIVSQARRSRLRDDWEDTRGQAIYDAFVGPKPSVRGIVSAGNKVFKAQSEPSSYDAYADRTNLKAAESDYDRRARLRPKAKEK